MCELKECPYAVRSHERTKEDRARRGEGKRDDRRRPRRDRGRRHSLVARVTRELIHDEAVEGYARHQREPENAHRALRAFDLLRELATDPRYHVARALRSSARLADMPSQHCCGQMSRA